MGLKLDRMRLFWGIRNEEQQWDDSEYYLLLV